MDTNISGFSIAYCIISIVLMLLGTIKAHAGIGLLGQLFSSIIENFNFRPDYETMLFSSATLNLSDFVFFSIIIQSFYTSRFIEKLSSENSNENFLNNILIACGNAFFSCFLVYAYSSVPNDLLESFSFAIGFIIAAVWIVLLMIPVILLFKKTGFLKGVYIFFTIGGLFMVFLMKLGNKMDEPTAIGRIITGIIIVVGIIILLINPLITGIVCALLPSIIMLFIYDPIYKYFVFRSNTILCIITFLISYPLGKLLENLVSFILDKISDWDSTPVLDIVFFCYSIISIFLWIFFVFK